MDDLTFKKAQEIKLVDCETVEEVVRTFRDIAPFRWVYIRESVFSAEHPLDEWWDFLKFNGTRINSPICDNEILLWLHRSALIENGGVAVKVGKDEKDAKVFNMNPLLLRYSFYNKYNNSPVTYVAHPYALQDETIKTTVNKTLRNTTCSWELPKFGTAHEHAEILQDVLNHMFAVCMLFKNKINFDKIYPHTWEPSPTGFYGED